MSRTIKILCNRDEIESVEAKLLELDKAAQLHVEGPSRLAGVIEGLSILASVSTIAASSFVVWAEAQRQRGKSIEVDEKPIDDGIDGNEEI